MTDNNTFDGWEPMKFSLEPRESLVKIENGSIGLKDGNRFSYWIELTRIKTERDLLEWVHHLTGKVWVTNDLLDDFIQAVFKYRGWTLYKGV